jgi:hypothetical protein
MQKVSLALAILGSAVSLAAQSSCGGPAPVQQLSNRADFVASFYYDLGAQIFDLDVQVPISLSGAHTLLFDQGVSGVPNQVGNTAVVDVYTCPTTRIGNETNAPSNPGSPWTLRGSGTITVVNAGVGNGESPVVFNPPLSIPAGAYGVCLVYRAPSVGTNAGPLHCLGYSLGYNPNPAPSVADDFLRISNDAIVGRAWDGVGHDSPNLRLDYLPAANSGHSEAIGEGCYFHPHAFYESFASSGVSPDLANTSQSWGNLGSNYAVASSGASYVAPAGASLTLSPPGSSCSDVLGGPLAWDDALSTPIVLPFNFPFPGGSTNEITISSNGSIYLASVVDNSFDACSAPYGDIAAFRNGPARISAYSHDLDPSAGGGIYYEVGPSNAWVRVTFASVQEFGVPSSLSTMQITLSATGDVDVVYGALGNQVGGNNAIVGFTPGMGSRLPSAMDLSASLPFHSGEGDLPPVLSMDARPVMGTNPNIVTSSVAPGTLFQFFLAGLSGVVSPVNLAPYGLPDCFQHMTPFMAFLSGIGGNGEFSVGFPIPNVPVAQGLTLYFQCAPLTTGLNAAGLLTTNGLCATIGQ